MEHLQMKKVEKRRIVEGERERECVCVRVCVCVCDREKGRERDDQAHAASLDKRPTTCRLW